MRDLFPQDLIKRWDDALKRSERIVLSTHMNPDGDAVGSLMGLGLFLRQLGFRVSMVCPSPYPGFLKFLDPDREILVFSRNREEVIQKITEADTIIAVDVSSFSRMEELGEIHNFMQGYLVEVDKNQNVRVIRMDFYHEKAYEPVWIIPAPKEDKSHLLYTEVLKDKSKRPYFEDTEIDLSDSLTYTFIGRFKTIWQCINRDALPFLF